MKCETISLVNQKGGVAKTTSTINLGAALAEKGYKVLLLDMDGQASLTRALGFAEADDMEYTMPGLLEETMHGKEVDRGPYILHQESMNVDLIPSSIRFLTFERRLNEVISREYVLKRAIKPLQEIYDYILIDCPPQLSTVVLNALTASTKVIIPCHAHFLSIVGFNDLIENISLIQAQINPDLEIMGILMTMVQARANLTKSVIEIIDSMFAGQIRLFETSIPHSIRAAEAAMFGKSVLKLDSQSRVAQAYRNVAEEVVRYGAQ